MTKAELIRNLENIFEADEGTLDSSDVLSSLDGWGSLAVLSFIALVDKKLGVRLEAQQVYRCRTVEDLCMLAGDRLAD